MRCRIQRLWLKRHRGHQLGKLVVGPPGALSTIGLAEMCLTIAPGSGKPHLTGGKTDARRD